VGGWFPVTTVLSVALKLCGRATDNAHITCRKKGQFFCISKKSDAFYGQVDVIVICFCT